MAPAGPQAWHPDDFTAHRDGKKFSARILDMIKNDAEGNSPNGKPAMVYGLASTLTTPEDVPRQLREIFTHLQQLTH